MEIKTQNTLIGAGAGAAVGTVAGAAVGMVKTKDVRAKLKDAVKLTNMDVDTYVKEHVSQAKAKQIAAGIKPNKVMKNLQKVAQKAKEDFPKLVETAKKNIPDLTKTRNKTFLTIAGIGLAAGALVGGIVGNITSKK